MTPSRRRPLALLAVLLTALALSALPAAATNHEGVIDITFPVDGKVSYTDSFDAPRGGGTRVHKAADLGGPDAYGLPVVAAEAGTVRWITGLDGNPPDYGYMIRIDGDDGRSYEYIHLGRQNGPVREAYAPGIQRGTRVSRGQVIGYVGHSGNASASWPHLHFAIEDPAVTDPYGTNYRNPYASLVAAEQADDHGGPFRDVRPEHRFHDAIAWMDDAGISEGYRDGKFRPRRTTTRQAMVQFLYVLAGEPRSGHAPDFSDVPAGHAFADAIGWAEGNGIVTGFGDGTFRPTETVSRQAAAAFLHRLADEPAAAQPASFHDVDDEHRFATAIAWAQGAGVVQGYDDGAFRPGRGVRRQAAASFLYEYAHR